LAAAERPIGWAAGVVARNIEVKARIPANQIEAIRERAAALALKPPEVLCQIDTFFNIPKGRLKLREFTDGPAELIFYERPDQAGPKPSSYIRLPIVSPKSLHEALSGVLGVRGVVEKRREVLRVGQTRIHLDEVQALGSFLELEVVLRESQPDAEGEVIAEQLLRELGLRTDCLVSAAYIDLLEEVNDRAHR
jgi:predicted adenylyl cyclase CyaB